MLQGELLSSYQEGALERLAGTMTTFPAGGTHEMVVLSNIPFSSLCAHHMLPFFGQAAVGYIPGERIVGLSKIPRVVDFFSRKLQVQERLTQEVADYLMTLLAPKAVIVMMEARHFCMEVRGVSKPGVVTRTSALRGLAMDDAAVRVEFYRLIDSR